MIGLMNASAFAMWATVSGWGAFLASWAMFSGMMSLATWWCPPASFGWGMVYSTFLGASMPFLATGTIPLAAYVGSLVS